MAMAKINVSMPDGLVEDLDEVAAWLKRSRSGVIQEASSMYVTMLHEQRATEERQADIGTARREMKKLAKDLEAFDSTAAVRADRDGHGRKAGQR